MKILYVRSGPYQVNINSYNLQEIGLATEFIKSGIDCDILYYNKKSSYDEFIDNNGIRIKILWRKGIRLLRSGIYPQILNKKFLSNYDTIIVSEYSQIMAVLLCFFHKNVYIYNGPYYNLFKIPFLEKIYDFLFCKFLNEKIKKIYCKTNKSENYINRKGLINTTTVGVGLNVSKFDNVQIDNNVENLLEVINNKRVLLYIGSISKRKNVKFLIQVFNKLKKDSKFKDVVLLLIGKSEGNYLNDCLNEISDEYRKSIIIIEKIPNSQLKFIYQKADIFLLSSLQEIMGMVLLEAMYFGVPCVCSNTAGSTQLIENGVDGFILNNYSVDEWSNQIKQILNNPEFGKQIGELASKNIKQNYMWINIVNKMKKYF